MIGQEQESADCIIRPSLDFFSIFCYMKLKMIKLRFVCKAKEAQLNQQTGLNKMQFTELCKVFDNWITTIVLDLDSFFGVALSKLQVHN